MKLLTTTEGKVLLLLCKDFTTDYNANSLANRLNNSSRHKCSKGTEKRGTGSGQTIWKSCFL